MAVLEKLNDQEKYLYAILSDPSGLDQAEFLWHQADHYLGCFRAWPFQQRWWRTEDPLVLDQCARSVGKSLSIKVKSCAFAILYPDQEMVITAPEGNHLQAISDLIETTLLSTRFYREFLLPNANSGITHRPFLAKFRNGARIMGRIPQRDGRGIKGVHPLHLELDEAQDYPDAGYTEVIETLKRGVEGASWRAHGVTRGVRDKFFEFSQPGSGWTVFQYTAMHRPTWSEEERAEKVKMYGSEEHPDYKRNVFGEHGDIQNSLFVFHRLMRCIDFDADSDYNQDIYTKIDLVDEVIQAEGGEILNFLDIPMSHKKWKTVWAGADIGMTNHPTEILVFGEEPGKKKGDPSSFRLLTRIHMERIRSLAQTRVILWLFETYGLQGFAMDRTGLGLPIFQDAQDLAALDPQLKKYVERIKGYNFSEKILVDFDDTIDVTEFDGDMVEDTGIKRNTLEYASDVLRGFVDEKRLILPDDIDLIREFQGQTFKVEKSPTDMYGRKVYSKGNFHALDGARMAVLGYTQYGIEKMLEERRKLQRPGPVLDMFIPI